MVGKKLVDVDISTNVSFDEDEWNFFGEDKLGEEVVVFTPVKEIMNDHFGVSTNFWTQLFGFKLHYLIFH